MWVCSHCDGTARGGEALRGRRHTHWIEDLCRRGRRLLSDRRQWRRDHRLLLHRCHGCRPLTLLRGSRDAASRRRGGPSDGRRHDGGRGRVMRLGQCHLIFDRRLHQLRLLGSGQRVGRAAGRRGRGTVVPRVLLRRAHGGVAHHAPRRRPHSSSSPSAGNRGGFSNGEGSWGEQQHGLRTQGGAGWPYAAGPRAAHGHPQPGTARPGKRAQEAGGIFFILFLPFAIAISWGGLNLRRPGRKGGRRARLPGARGGGDLRGGMRARPSPFQDRATCSAPLAPLCDLSAPAAPSSGSACGAPHPRPPPVGTPT